MISFLAASCIARLGAPYWLRLARDSRTFMVLDRFASGSGPLATVRNALLATIMAGVGAHLTF